MSNSLKEYTTNAGTAYLGDLFDILPQIPKNSVDLIFADPPYFLSNGGISCSAGKMVSVDKGDWDKGFSLADKHEFNKSWISLCKETLKDTGSIWISGTFHNIYSIGMALEENGFKILNNITWRKTNPPPNLSCRYFTHSTETLLWAKKNMNKAKHKFNYSLMKELNNNKQMKDVWEGSLTKPSEKKFGKHPTQKPEYLLERILLACTDEGDLVLDPFLGSGTPAAVASKLKRNFIGIEKEPEYFKIIAKRLEAI
ncbi:MAG: site-specific DNA-methyltransferase [Enterococcus sp.]|nr:site-specific DNA-methyltransferase [Enterococcus sp.]